MTLIIPDRNAGDVGHIADHNAIVNSIESLQAAVGDGSTLVTTSSGVISAAVVPPSIARRGDLVLNVKDPTYGAVGDGAANDTVAIQAAVTAGQTAKRAVLVPAGTYMVDTINLLSDAHVILDPGAVLQARTGNMPIFQITGFGVPSTTPLQRVSIEGGELIGTWDYATYQGTNPTGQNGGRKAAENLIFIANNTATTIRDITVRNVRIRRGASSAIRINPGGSTTSIREVLVDNVQMIQCWYALYCLNDNSNSPNSGVFTFRRIFVDETWTTGAYPTGAAAGGNAFFCGGYFEDLIFDQCRAVRCGRITLEVTFPTWFTDHKIGKRLTIRDCYLGPGDYRTLSVGAEGMKLVDNWVVETDWLEIYGTDVLMEGNTFDGMGWQTQGYGADATTHNAWSRRWRIVHNIFRYRDVTLVTNPTQGVTPPINVLYGEDMTIAFNDILVETSNSGPAVGRIALIVVSNSRKVRVFKNRIRWTASVLSRPLVRYTNVQLCEFNDNQFDIDATSVIADVDNSGQPLTPVSISRLDRSSFSRNQFRASSYLGTGYPFWPWITDPTRIVRRAFTSATAYTDTVAADGALNTPPGSPADGAVYLTGDTPTGTWAGHGGQFATWSASGSSWSYEVVKDVYADMGDVPYVDPNGGIPERAATGEVYALVRGASVGSEYVDNIIDTEGNLIAGTTLGTGRAKLVVWATAIKGVSWRNKLTGQPGSAIAYLRAGISRDLVLTNPGGQEDVQTFTANGTWTKPAGAKTVVVEGISGGGGGASGRRGAAGTVRCGGGGGGGGGYTRSELDASTLPSTVAVTVGVGGTGGTGAAVDDTNGSAGGVGGYSFFGSYFRTIPGLGGSGGTNAAGVGGAAGDGAIAGGIGAAASTTGGVGAVGSAGRAAPAGSAGGGITSADAPSAGGAGAVSFASAYASPAGGSVPGGAGAAGTNSPAGSPVVGASGGGGAASITGAAGAGGVAGLYGAGGSGGGASLNSNASGAGSAGAPGVVRVTTRF